MYQTNPNFIGKSKLFNQLIFAKQKKITSQLKIQTTLGLSWIFYLDTGKIVWAEGGCHPERSWQRLLIKYCSQFDHNHFHVSNSDRTKGSNYYILTVLLQRKLLTKEQAIEAIRNKVIEILFDLLQIETQQSLNLAWENNFNWFNSDLQKFNTLIDLEEAFQLAQQELLLWQKEGLIAYSPNLAPIVKEPEKLREAIPITAYQNMIRLLDGQRSLRDLACYLNKDLFKLASSLVPYLNQGLIKWIEIPDFQSKQTKTGQAQPAQNRPLIACVDDSPQICKVMEQIIIEQGYSFVAIQEAIQAIPTLVSVNPSLIFLDIGMPIINGYEICAQIKKVSQLKDIPVIILTGNDGMVDRIKAKMVGATEFISKPIEVEKISAVIGKYIFQNTYLSNS
jgi:chemotaxis family two-component system response regulator PixG